MATNSTALPPQNGTKTLPPKMDTLVEALQGCYGDDPQRIATAALRWAETLINKNRDYGSSIWEMPLFAPNMDCSDAILIRMSDKISRLANLLKGHVITVKSETFEDTVVDLGSYCLLWLARPESTIGQYASSSGGKP